MYLVHGYKTFKCNREKYINFSLKPYTARLQLMHKTCWVDFTLGSPDWMVRLNAYTLYNASLLAWIMKLLEWGVHVKYSA